MRRFYFWFAVAIGAAPVATVIGCSRSPPPMPGAIPHGPGSRQDSIRTTASLLYGIARHIGQMSNASDRLPATLEPIIKARPTTRVWESYPTGFDVWNRALRYAPDFPGFQLRSAGPDGVFGTPDDIVAFGEHGRESPCTIISELQVLVIQPPCLQKGESATPTAPDPAPSGGEAHRGMSEHRGGSRQAAEHRRRPLPAGAQPDRRRTLPRCSRASRRPAAAQAHHP
jgi:hypothetical protein